MSEAAVRAVEEAYDRAWDAADLDGLVACFEPDAVLVNPRGEVAEGHDAIRAALGGFLGGEAKGSRHRGAVHRVTFVRPDVAVVDGRASITFDDHVLEHPFTDVVVLGTAGTWRISQVRAYGSG